MTTGSEPGLARLLRAASAVRIPDEVRLALAGDPGEPVPGQLWRTRWDETVELVLLLDVGEEGVVAIPISLGDVGDEQAVILQGQQTSLATSVTVWRSLVTRLPMCVLDRPLGSAHLDVTDDSWAERAIHAGAMRGHQAVGPLDPVKLVRAEISDRVSHLVSAAWAPTGDGRLGHLLSQEAISPQRLMEVLGVNAQTALALRRGQTAASPEHAVKLARLLHMGDEEILQANPAPPRMLVQRMSRPHRRAQVCALATRRSVPERSAWLSATYAVHALAARQTGTATVPAWDERIDRYFQVTLGR